MATPETSPHVSGDAVDIGPSDAAAWLSEHGAAVRAVPDLRQRTLALRTAPRSHRSRLPAHVRRPHARSEDAAVTRTRSAEPLNPHAKETMSRPDRRACRRRPDRRGLSAERRDRHGSGTGSKTAANPGTGGEVRRVHARERRQRVPGPGRVGRADDRWGGERLVAGPDSPAWEAAIERVQGPAATGVHGRRERTAEEQAAASSSPSASATTA